MGRRRRLAAGLLVVAVAPGCTVDGGRDAAAVGAVAPSPSGAATRSAALAEGVQAAVARVWPRTRAFWPGADFAAHRVIVGDGDAAFAVDAGGLRPVSPDEFAAQGVRVPGPGGADAVTWDGEPSVVVRPEAAGRPEPDPTGLRSADPALALFALATRELFHLRVQEDWPSLAVPAEGDGGGPGGGGPRGDGPGGGGPGGGGPGGEGPAEAGARLYRAMVYNRLLDAYRDPGARDGHLAAAAYWHGRWAAEYPREAAGQRRADLVEGTAAYVEQYAVAMAAADDPAAYVTRTYRPMTAPDRDAEPRAIGALALLNADALGLDAKRRLAREPVTPVEALLEGVEPRRDAVPAEVRAGFARGAAEARARPEPSVAP
ncbi:MULTISPECIES: hypothetical protein [Streptomyces]|uniref:hypothetical protein n=1 Tax=Streptomyces TaxID=1883 RepID=UPI002248B63A|nr:hypothetical protein [Streptomyces sp. JHD 1]MCX2968871.1 hypothetical protein [Streptomyces sp. JHD 1]